MQELLDNMRFLVEKRRIISGIHAAWGGAGWTEQCSYGNLQEVEEQNGELVENRIPLPKDAIYDLASITKLFTCLLLVILEQEGRLRLEDPIGTLDPRFSGILDVPLLDLMQFRQALSTEHRIDQIPDRESAKQELFSIRKAPKPKDRYYTDMGAMVLKYAAEAAMDLPLYEGIRNRILIPAGMTSTFCQVPKKDVYRTVCYNFERRCLGGVYTVDYCCQPGTVHDLKARILSPQGEDLCGHAGLFSTVEDMTRLAWGLLSGELISRNKLRWLGINRTGYRKPDGTYTQFLGTMCFSKNPVQTFSEVPECFGEQTVAMNGFTGNHFSVDPDRGLFMILLSNRIHNRVTIATGRANPYETEEWVDWPDGKKYPLSQNYVYCKDRYLKGPIGRILAEREQNS